MTSDAGDPVSVGAVSSSRLEAGRRGRRQVALFWGAAVVSLVLLAPFGAQLSAFLAPCPLKTLTGYPCPTCGSTRAAMALANFDFLRALVTYPLPTLGWIGFIFGGLGSSAWVLSGRDLPGLPRRVPAWALGLGITVVLLNWAWSIHTGV